MLHLSTTYKACNLVTPYYRIRCLTSICKHAQRNLQELQKRNHGNQQQPISKDLSENVRHLVIKKSERNEEGLFSHGGKNKQLLWPEGTTSRQHRRSLMNKEKLRRGLHPVSKRRWGNHLTACIQHRCEGIPDGDKVKCALNHCEMFQLQA